MPRRFIVFANAIGLMFLMALPSSASEEDLYAEIRPAFESLKKAFYEQDGAALKNYMTEDGLLITPFYRAALTVDEVAASLGTFKVQNHNSHQVKVIPVGPNAALMTLYTSFLGTFDGKPLPPWVFASALWVKQGDDWRVKIYQETAVDTP